MSRLLLERARTRSLDIVLDPPVPTLPDDDPDAAEPARLVSDAAALGYLPESATVAEVIDFAEALGIPLLPWQERVLRSHYAACRDAGL